MEKSVLEAIEKFSLFEKGTTVTVALSGGADSMALLYVLNSLKEELNITLRAAHLNHLIRGEEAFSDEEFVKKTCENLNIPLFIKREDVPAFAENEGISTELAARKLRYSFLESIAEGGVVATAHTASDNLETVILNLVRGSGIDGVAGIPAKRGIFVRPIILSTRADVEGYCEKNKIPYVTDSTNLSDDYTRNKIRHNIVPLLKELNPSAESTVLRSSMLLREDGEFLNQTAKRYISENLSADHRLNIKDFKDISLPIAKRIIKEYIKNEAPEISLENVHIENALNTALSGGRTGLPKKHTLYKEGKFLRVSDDENTKTVKFEVSFSECDNVFYETSKKINNLFLKSSLNCDKIVGKLVLRTREVGDTIRIAGRGCTKTLRQLYNECGIPNYLRETLPVLADDLGVVWVCDIGVAQRCVVNNKTKRIIKIDVKREE